MIKAIIFDCFGVLTTDGWLAFCDTHFLPNSDVREQARTFNKRVDAGLISYDDFISGVADLAGITAAQAHNEISNNHVANEALFTYIRDKIKPNYPIGMLSNAAENWLDELFAPWQVALFDKVVMSYQVGAIKPDAIMYETIAAELGMLPEECLFIDDQPRYVTGATDTGMQAILFQDTEQFVRDFEEMTK